MTSAIVAVAFAVALAVVAGALTRLVQNERRAFARERALLINQLLHAVGNPWEPPPAALGPLVEKPDTADDETGRYTYV